jgi:bifunctional non-homologous end joining protein LigD
MNRHIGHLPVVTLPFLATTLLNTKCLARSNGRSAGFSSVLRGRSSTRVARAREDRDERPAVSASSAGWTPASLVRTLGGLPRPTSMREVMDVEAYLYEIKYDGYRLRAAKAGGDVRLFTRGGHDWTTRFGGIDAAVRKLPAREAVIDGEVCVVNDAGRPSLGALQAWLAGAHRADDQRTALAYVAFDLSWLDGRDLRNTKLEERRGLLETLLEDSAVPLSFSRASAPTTRAELATLLETVRSAGLEGLIAKRRGSKYQPGTSGTWRKLKFTRRQDCVIVGWAPTTGTTDQLGALIVAIAEAGKLRYAGRVGVGINDRTRASILAELTPLDVSNMAAPVPRMRETRWVRPELVCEVEYTDWSRDRTLQTPVFIRRREDKTPAECTVEEEEP